jgi:hypothetical protein
MKFRFLGNYTGDRDSITMGGVTFHDRDAAEVSDQDLIRRLKNNPEFHAVAGHAEPKVSEPPVKRKKKAAK